MFLGINIFWALLRAHFSPRLTARAKMSLSRAQNIFMPANINSIVIIFLRHFKMKLEFSITCRSWCQNVKVNQTIERLNLK